MSSDTSAATRPAASPSAGASRTRVDEALARLGIATEIVEFGEATRTSVEAAAAIGCEVAQIAKSIVFRGKRSDRCVLVIASGADRIDEKKLRDELDEPVSKADAEFVRRRTGFAIGGVAPVGHTGPVTIVVDKHLWNLDPIWAAAGTPRTVFRLSADALHRIPDIRVADVRQHP